MSKIQLKKTDIKGASINDVTDSRKVIKDFFYFSYKKHDIGRECICVENIQIRVLFLFRIGQS